MIDRELNQLEAYRRDYGVWDAAYNFLTGAYPTFLDEELPVSLLQELGLNIYIYLGADGAVIDGVAVDGAMKSEVATETYAPVRFKTWKGFQEQLAPDSGAQTIVATRAGLMLIAYAPVTHTDGSGDFVGHLATGRLLDADFIAALSKQTRVELDIVPISEADSVAAFSEKSIKRADGIVTVAAPLRGVDGELLRDHEEVHGSLRCHVLERQRQVILVQNLRRDFFADDLAEDRVAARLRRLRLLDLPCALPAHAAPADTSSTNHLT